MKWIFAALLLIFSSHAAASAFCDGFQAGYKEGYCYQKFSCIRPIPPICPIPNIGEQTFQDGYNRGFLAGVNSR